MFFSMRYLLLSVLLGISLAAQANSTDQRPSVAAGSGFSLGLHSNGFVYAWGNNAYGQLGDGTTTLRSTPVKVADISDIQAIAAGANHSVALRTDGTVWTWGQNIFGQLGDGTTTAKFKPVQITNLTGIVAIAVGDDFSLALKNDGTVWAWGRNNIGQLGDGATSNHLTPSQIPNLQNVTAIAAGSYHVLALNNTGAVYAWGDNTYGQLGQNNVTPYFSPIVVPNLSSVTNVYAGYGQSYALKSDKVLAVWGLNSHGQLGDTTNTNSLSPKTLTTLAPIEYVSVGAGHVFAKPVTGSYLIWGLNTSGQLGNDATVDVKTPTTILNDPLDKFSKISGGLDHSLGLTSTGEVYSWGRNTTSQLGNGKPDDSKVGQPVSGVGNSGTFSLTNDIGGTTDTLPDAFSFTAQNNVTPQAEIRSNEITLAGINAATNISITNGEYSINAGAFTSNFGSITPGDRVVVRHTASAAYGQKTTTTVNIGGVVSSFESTTVASDSGSGSGGGCTLAHGQHDLSTVLLLATAILIMFRRRLKGHRYVA